MRGSRWRIVAVALGCMGFGLVSGARRVEAIPAYARQLGGVSCNLCHAPIFPRLNRTGWEFRNAGYRMPADLAEPKPPAPVCAPPCPTGTSAVPPATAARGRQVYAAANCSACHRIGGQGGTLGVALDSPAVRRDQASLTAVLRKPPTGSSMPAYTGSEADLEALVGYLQSLGSPAAPTSAAPMNERDQLKAELKAEIMAELRAEHPDWFHQETQVAAAPPPAPSAKPGNLLADMGNTLSIQTRLRYDLIGRDSTPTFSQFSVHDVTFFLSSPIGRNYGYFVEELFGEQNVAFDPPVNRFVLEEPESELENVAFRFASGEPEHYFAARAGQFHIIDGVLASDRRSITTIRPSLWDLTINGFNLAKDQRGVETSFTSGPSTLLVSALNGIYAEGTGTGAGRLSSLTDWLVQFVHFFGRQNNSLHLVFYDGHNPLTEDENARNDFTRVAGFANLTFPIEPARGRYFNLLTGMMKARDARFVLSGGEPVDTGQRFSSSAFFGEGELYLNRDLIGLYRFDRTDTNEPTPVFPGNPRGRQDRHTLGLFYTPQESLRLGLQYQMRRLNGYGPDEDRLQAEVWMIW